MFGDFEDVEAGVAYKGGDEVTAVAAAAIKAAEVRGLCCVCFWGGCWGVFVFLLLSRHRPFPHLPSPSPALTLNLSHK